MSTHKKIDLVCLVSVIISVLLAALFIGFIHFPPPLLIAIRKFRGKFRSFR